MVSAEIPRGPVEVPALVLAYTRGAPTAVWINELGGVTFRDDDRFVKWNPVGNGIDLDDERARLEWVGDRFPVPRVLDAGRDDAGQVLITAALPGRGAVTEPWIGRPLEAARAIGAALRAFHDALPAEDCPWPAWPGDRPTPPITRPVVCHGDACAPNILIAPDGSPAGMVDLGQLGVGDPWADLAVASLSLDWNYRPDSADALRWENELFGAYGIARDEERIHAYRALWEAAPSRTRRTDPRAP